MYHKTHHPCCYVLLPVLSKMGESAKHFKFPTNALRSWDKVSERRCDTQILEAWWRIGACEDTHLQETGNEKGPSSLTGIHQGKNEWRSDKGCTMCTHISNPIGVRHRTHPRESPVCWWELGWCMMVVHGEGIRCTAHNAHWRRRMPKGAWPMVRSAWCAVPGARCYMPAVHGARHGETAPVVYGAWCC